MRRFKRERGYLTFAQNGATDYLRMAYALALSLKATQSDVPHLSVVVTPGTEVPAKYRAVFDEVIDVPWNDEAATSAWKLENEWKAYHITPYRETVKLDADMLFLSDVSGWWEGLARQDVFACTTALTYRGEPITDDFYRKTFTANRLPNLYSAFMFFRYSDLAEEWFAQAEIITHNWQRFFFDFLDDTRPAYLSTDVVFALAAKLIDRVDECVYPAAPYPKFVHMKAKLQDWPERQIVENWTQHVDVAFTPDLHLKIGRYRQIMPFHYHDKAFLTDAMIAAYETALGVEMEVTVGDFVRMVRAAEQAAPAPDGFLVYYDPAAFGVIKGVSSRPVPELAAYPHLPVAAEIGRRLAEGDGHLDQWFVREGDDGPVLTQDLPTVVTLRVIDGDYFELRPTALAAPVSLLVRIGQLDREMAVVLNRASPKIVIETEETELPFFLTKKGDPSHIFERISIPVNQLIREGRVIVPVKTDVRTEFSVYTKRLFDAYSLDIARWSVATKPLPPGRCHNTVHFARAAGPVAEPCLLAERDGARLRFRLVAGGGEVYAISVGTLPVVLFRDGDPTRLLHGLPLKVIDLANENVLEFDLPPDVAAEDFDLCTARFFEKMIFVS